MVVLIDYGEIIHQSRGSNDNFVVPSVGGINIWNSLPSNVKARRYFNGFKGAAKCYLRTYMCIIWKCG